MGKQSSRLYFQGKDHKDVYFQGNYHDAMYVGSQLVWEKIYDEPVMLWLDEVNSNVEHETIDKCIMYPDGTVAFAHGYGYYASDYCTMVFSGGKIGGTITRTYQFDLYILNGENFGIFNRRKLSIFIPEQNFVYDEREYRYGNFDGGYINGVFLAEDNGIVYIDPFSTGVGGTPARLKEHLYIDGNEVAFSEVTPWPYGNEYIHNHVYGESFQWYNGKLYAHLYYRDNVDYGTCSTSDGFHWTSGEPIVGRGRVINNILFLQNGVAVDTNMDIVAYTKKPAFYWNGYYYAEQIEKDNYLLRSKDLIEWEKYRKIKDGYKYNAQAYWAEKRYLCLECNNNIYKLRMNL